MQQFSDCDCESKIWIFKVFSKKSKNLKFVLLIILAFMQQKP